MSTPDILKELHTSEQEPHFSEMDYKITNEEITKASLNVKASPQPDKFSGSFLPAGNSILLPALNIFFNRLFSMATQPAIARLEKGVLKDKVLSPN